MCLSSSINLDITTVRPIQHTTTLLPRFKIEPDTWLRTMLVFYSLNAKLNHLTGDWPQEYWMTQLPPYVRQRPLTMLSIPGSHDSFAYSLDTDQAFAPDLDSGVSSIATLLSNVIPTVKVVIHNWSKTQQLTFVEQLHAGVRYFDMRIGYFQPTKKIRFLHGLWGPNMEDEIAKLPAFLDSHPKEVVFLDFNHIYSGFREGFHQEFVNIILSKLGDYLIPYRDWSVNHTTVDLTNLTLETLALKPKQQVFVFYEFDNAVNLSSSVIWPGYSVATVWPRTTDGNDMVQQIDSIYKDRVHDLENVTINGPPRYFFVYQGVLTPDSDAITSNLLGSLYETAVPFGTSAFVKWLEKIGNNAKMGLNICIVDGVESYNFLPIVVAMNIF